jgi:hypothetical protein
MKTRDNILQELQELQSMLAATVPQSTYSVPVGYFEGLAEQVLNRIKTLEADNAADELNVVAPTLANLSKAMPYKVPQEYFAGLPEKMLRLVQENNLQSAKEELESISPLLSGLKKEMPFSVPQGYFETTLQSPAKPEIKVVSISSRKWFRYAAAAVVVGIIATAGYLYLNQSGGITARSLAKFEKTLNKEIKKTSDKELDEFLQQFSDAGLTGEEKVTTTIDKEVKELLKDVSETELKEFLEETSEAEISTTSEKPSIMN